MKYRVIHLSNPMECLSTFHGITYQGTVNRGFIDLFDNREDAERLAEMGTRNKNGSIYIVIEVDE